MQKRNSNGKGIIVANRRKYPSYWFLGSHLSFPAEWVQWFVGQANADLFYHNDGNGEHLNYGMYHRYHTIESIKKELGYTFNVIECKYEEDPRYIVCVVTRENNQNNQSNSPFRFETDDYEKWDYDILQTEKIVSMIETACNILKIHRENILEYSQNNAVKNPLQEIKLPVKEFLMLFEELFEYVTVTRNI